MEEEMRTTILNIIVVVLTVVMWLPLATFGGVANADGPVQGKGLQGVSTRVTYPTVDVVCGQFRFNGYTNNVRVNTITPVSVSGSYTWSTVYGHDGLPVSRSWAFPATTIFLPGRTLLREVTSDDYLQQVQLSVRPLGFDITQKCSVPRIVTRLSFLNGQPWLEVTTRQVLYTQKGEPIRFKRFNLSEQPEFALYMPGRTEGFYANFEWIRTIQ